MARGPHLSELAAEWQALGAKPQHVRRIFLAWAGLAPWEARKGESFPKAVAEALPGIRERLDRLSHALPVRSAEAETVKLILGTASASSRCCCPGRDCASPLRWAAPSGASSA